jgi:hypothetical protein
MKYVNKILDRAERFPLHIPVAAATLGYGIGSLIHGYWYGWVFFGVGIIFTAIRPFGTGLRRRIMIRQLRKIVDSHRVEQ